MSSHRGTKPLYRGEVWGVVPLPKFTKFGKLQAQILQIRGSLMCFGLIVYGGDETHSI